MNAKELADSFRRDADNTERFHGVVKPSYLRAMADCAEVLVPKYRPPQPSDDGKYCWIEMFERERANRPYRLDRSPDGEWRVYSELLDSHMPLTGGVWPCERPEGGGT